MLSLALHDLRNSLSAIQLGLELLGRRDGASQQQQQQPPSAVLAHMDNAAQRAQALVVELDDLTRLAAGRTLPVSPVRCALHTIVRDALDACRFIVPGVAVEHDRLGDGDCMGDPARMAQFLNLALEELCSAAAPVRVIVISEVAGDRFRMAVHAEGAADAAPAADEPKAAPARAQARRRVLLQAIAQAHGGHVGFEGGYASGVRSIEGSFSRLADPHPTSEQDIA
ncbi:histidine kinase dimerization/phospho-acceptor domain-containing protein [Variovorax sp. LT1R16]|uniref:histidine kinase dimerization/phospho-acceptor domain-containing protein n=1 Tax=Variovorax sp. LT1R16 TaxID=3443728 RepID=UPI003F44AE7E